MKQSGLQAMNVTGNKERSFIMKNNNNNKTKRNQQFTTGKGKF